MRYHNKLQMLWFPMEVIIMRWLSTFPWSFENFARMLKPLEFHIFVLSLSNVSLSWRNTAWNAYNIPRGPKVLYLYHCACNTILKCCSWFSYRLEYTRISSINTIMNLPKYGLNTLLIMSINVAGASIDPKGMSRNS